ncbi:hypothetical protein [Cohnella luojiensis]|uniref:hypothetical protein n=1 Tax=Cohnella luojiensis TaxID=652876 RepID=UPI00142FC26D|nr:hypothetical protein [Cohnella luojiensis]
MSIENNNDESYNEASVPTPQDKQDASPIDMVSDAVEEVIFGEKISHPVNTKAE